MKKLLVLFLIISANLNGQIPVDLNFKSPIAIICKKKFTNDEGKKISVGDIFEIFSMSWDVNPINNTWVCELFLKNPANNLGTNISQSEIANFTFIEINSPDKVWNEILLKSEVLPNISKRGLQYEIRNSMIEDDQEYLNKLFKTGQIYKEEYFEDYLYTLSTKIHPGTLDDGRQGNVSFYILDNILPNAFCLSNGTIIITTGLLSTIQSEDELVGIIAHEIAHFVLDHQILNKNAIADRKKRADFWASFATSIAAVADGYLASQYRNHPTGALTYSVAMASVLISQEILSEMGLKFSQEQEKEADIAANNILASLKYNKLGLKVALRRIKEHLILTGDFISLTGKGSHPDIDSRIGEDGEIVDISKFTKSEYLVNSSLITSTTAEHQMFDYAHHLKALELVERNIKNNVAVESDYLIKAIVNRRLSNSKESNENAIKNLEKALSLNISNDPRIYKHLGISYLRINNKIKAKDAFLAYIENRNNWLKKYENEIHTYKGDIDFVQNEMFWARKMIYKIDELSPK